MPPLHFRSSAAPAPAPSPCAGPEGGGHHRHGLLHQLRRRAQRGPLPAVHKPLQRHPHGAPARPLGRLLCVCVHAQRADADGQPVSGGWGAGARRPAHIPPGPTPPLLLRLLVLRLLLCPMPSPAATTRNRYPLYPHLCPLQYLSHLMDDECGVAWDSYCVDPYSLGDACQRSPECCHQPAQHHYLHAAPQVRVARRHAHARARPPRERGACPGVHAHAALLHPVARVLGAAAVAVLHTRPAPPPPSLAPPRRPTAC